MKKKLLVIITIISVMSWILIPGAFADTTSPENTEQTLIDGADNNTDEAVNADQGKAKGKHNDKAKGEDKNDVAKPWEEAKDKLEAEKDALESQKDALEAQKDSLEEQYEAAKESGNTELAGQLAAQIESLKTEIDSSKQLMKAKQAEIKATIRSAYTTEELDSIEALSEKLKNENKGITVMSVDSIVAKGRNLKFDTPPVIKDGRTLIPVRALSEAFGATVAWDPAEQKVTISSGTTEIVLNLDSNTAFVNGVEVTIDVAPTSLNSRTIVPLRFITETLGLKVDWDDETDTVEISDGTTPPLATGDTVTVTPTAPAAETPATGTTTDTTPTETPAITEPDAAIVQ